MAGVVLLVVCALLLAGWSIVVPVFEAPDEPAHWQYARFLHDHWKLPRYSQGVEEANSPPLYYLLIAPVATDTPVPKSLTRQDDAGRHRAPNRPERFDSPKPGFGGYEPIRVARLLTVFISTITVWLCFLVGREVTGRTATGILSGGFVLLLPMFTFRGMNISNDALMVLFCAAFTYGCARILTRGWNRRRGVLVVLALTAAFLTKPSAIVLAPVFAFAVWLTTDRWMRRLHRLSTIGLGAVIAAPWLWRNWTMYGDALASEAMYTAVPHLVVRKSLTDPYFYSELPVHTFMSFVGNFGWMSLRLPSWIYAVFAAGMCVAAFGLVRAWRRTPAIRPLLTLLGAAFPLSVVFLVYINLRFTQPQGRFLFMALPAMGALAAIGFETLPRWRPRFAWILLGVLFAMNVSILAFVVFPAYDY